MPASESLAHALVVSASSVQAFAPRAHTQLAMLVLARRLHVGGLELAKPLPNVEAPLGNLPPPHSRASKDPDAPDVVMPYLTRRL